MAKLSVYPTIHLQFFLSKITQIKSNFTKQMNLKNSTHRQNYKLFKGDQQTEKQWVQHASFFLLNNSICVIIFNRTFTLQFLYILSFPIFVIPQYIYASGS